MRTTQNNKGFTLIELLLVIAIIGMIASIVVVSLQNSPNKRLDTKRVSDIQNLQKALGLYSTSQTGYPSFTGCINGVSDPVSIALHSTGALGPGSIIKDPQFPSDVAQCYYYSSTGALYTIRYTLQSDSSAGSVGNHTVNP